MSAANPSLEAKIVVLGAQGVGKTSLLLRYIKNQFKAGSTASTVGASFLTKKVVDDESDTTVRLQIWDTAGQERFRSISRLYYRGANACILCYSITDPASFTAMSHWLTELRAHLPPDIILHVVGTKADLVARDPSQRAVPFERCIAYVAENLETDGGATTPPPTTPGGILDDAKQRRFLQESGPLSPASKQSSGFWGMEAGWDCCHEVSASTGEGVDEVFRVVTRKLVEQNRKMSAQLASAMTPAPGLLNLPPGIVPKTPGLLPGTPGYFGLVRGREKGEGEGYFDRLGGEAPGARPGGSFRVGKDRRSWLGFPTPGFDRERTGWANTAGIEADAIDEGMERRLTGSSAGKEGSQRRGRCC